MGIFCCTQYTIRYFSEFFSRNIWNSVFFHSKFKLTIMFCWNLFPDDFSGCEILIRNEKFQNPKIQDAGTNMADMKFRNFICLIRSAILDFQKLEISTLYSDSATKKRLRNGFTKMLNVRQKIWLKGLRKFSHETLGMLNYSMKVL